MSTRDRSTGATTAHRWRAAALGLLGAAALAGVAVLTTRALVGLVSALSGRTDVDATDAVTVVALAVMALSLLWCVLLLVVSVVELVRPPRHRTARAAPTWQLAPDLVLRVSGLLLALTSLGSGAAHAAAPPGAGGTASVVSTTAAPVPSFGAPDGLPDHRPAPSASAPVPSFGAATDQQCQAPVPGWTPRRPPAVRARGAEHVRLLAGCTAEDTAEASVVVRRGDDLWSLVERHLGAQADAARVAEEWPRWFAANRDVIGDDPNALRAGQVLRIPAVATR